jgi:hypothetical protein
LKNPSRIRKEKISGGTTSRRTRSRELRVEELAEERRKEKVEAFENWKFFQVSGRKCRSSGGSTAVVRSAGEKKIWTVGRFSRPGRKLRRSTQAES